MRRRACAGGLVCAVAVSVLCGCGAGGGPLRHVAAAVNRTFGVTWARYEIALGGSRLFAAPIVVQGGRAAYDFGAGLGYEFLQLQSRGGGSQILSFDYEPATFVLAPSPAPPGLLPAGRFWISVPLTGPGADRALVAQAEGLGPVLPLDEVAWGARSASSLGTRVIVGVPMDEYRVSVNLARALSRARRAGQAAIASAIEQELAARPSGRLSIDVWVTGPGYVGKIESAPPSSGVGTVSFWFSSYVKPYTGTPPPASQVVPLASLARGGRSLWAIATGS